MSSIPEIEPEMLKALIAEVKALDQLPPSLEVLERMVKLVADRFPVPVTATRRVSGKPPNSVTYLDFKWGTPTRIMNVKLEDDGRYYCFYQYCADRYDKHRIATSSVAWPYVVGCPYPTVWRHKSPKR